jgi:diguanylate cyclase (GGDEF)-like protein
MKKKTTLILFLYALSVIMLNYFVNTKLFIIFTIGLCFITSTLIERRIIRKIKDETEEDHLTALQNKRAYSQKKQYFNSCDSIGVMVLDINNLKETNDTFRHIAGDELIVSVAQVIKKYTVKGVYSYRFGGDEFVMIFTNVTEEQLLDFKESLIKDFSKIDLQLSPLGVSVAVGHSYEENQIDVERHLKDADCDMYEAKRAMKQENGGTV